MLRRGNPSTVALVASTASGTWLTCRPTEGSFVTRYSPSFQNPAQGGGGGAAVITPELACTAKRHINQKLRGPLISQEQRHDEAVDALIQFNVMVRQGIKASVTMYTSLISRMAAAGFEWQAYKLFSRMLEEGLMPLPETYVALRRATAPHRQRLIDDISMKIGDHVNSHPGELVQMEKRRLERQKREAKAQFDILTGDGGLSLEEGGGGTTGADPISLSEVLESGGAALSSVAERAPNPTLGGHHQDSEEGSVPSSAFQPDSYAKMHIGDPRDVWRVHSARSKEMRKEPPAIQSLTPIKSDEFRAHLMRMHEEELRSFLTIHKKLRHGEKRQLVERVLQTVSEKTIGEMLARRAKFFNAVKDELEMQLEESRAADAADEEKAKAAKSIAGGTPDEEQDALDSEVLESRAVEQYKDVDLLQAQMNQDGESAGEEEGRGSKLSIREKFLTSPNVLHTPWGVIRKPSSGICAQRPSTRNPAREPPLTPEVLSELHSKAKANQLDVVPVRLLRDYARQFVITWSRKDLPALYETVQWHILTFPPDSVDPGVARIAREELEKKSVAKSLDTFEALQLFARHCKNLQVVDALEIVRATKRAKSALRWSERSSAAAERYEKHIEGARALRQAATEYRRDPSATPGPHYSSSAAQELGSRGGASGKEPLHILGLTNTESTDRIEGAELTSQELPPWEIPLKKNPFTLNTGTFGDPTKGEFAETIPGKFKVVPNQEAQTNFAVDLETLPSPVKQNIHESILTTEEGERRVKNFREIQSKRMSVRNTWAWRARVQERERKQKEKEKRLRGDEAPQPQGPQLRMGQLLTAKRGQPKLKYTPRKREF